MPGEEEAVMLNTGPVVTVAEDIRGDGGRPQPRDPGLTGESARTEDGLP